MRGKLENFTAQAKQFSTSFSHLIRILYRWQTFPWISCMLLPITTTTHTSESSIFSPCITVRTCWIIRRGFAMSCADHLSDVLCWQGLSCQQIFTSQVWKREHGLLIMLRDSSMHIPNIVSLNTAMLKAKSSFTWHPHPCWMSHCVKLHESPFWADLWKHVRAYSN